MILIIVFTAIYNSLNLRYSNKLIGNMVKYKSEIWVAQCGKYIISMYCNVFNMFCNQILYIMFDVYISS